MESVVSTYSASMSELKNNPSALIELAGNQPIAILSHNKPAVYLISATTYEMWLEKIEDYQLGLIEDRQLGIIIKNRQHEKSSALEVTLDEL